MVDSKIFSFLFSFLVSFPLFWELRVRVSVTSYCHTLVTHYMNAVTVTVTRSHVTLEE